MNHDQFFFHDLSQFPIVTARHGGAPLGYSAAWIREMELLVENPRTFVMVVPDTRHEAAHEDRRAMIEWQTANMSRLRARCRAFIAVERDAQALASCASAAKRWPGPSDCLSWRSRHRSKRSSAPGNCSAMRDRGASTSIKRPGPEI